MKYRRTTPILSLLVLITASGCSSTTSQRDVRVTSGLEASERYIIDRQSTGQANTPSNTQHSDRFATIAGTDIPWSEAQPLLAEAAGGIILEELALEKLLQREMRQQGLTLTPSMIEREELLLRDSLATDTAPNPDQAQRLLDEIRRQRGLGPQRYQSLLRRTAMLRALVQDRVTVDETSIERAYRIRYEPACRVRIITTDTMELAERARTRIDTGEEFSRVAAELSTDPSAVRGGIVEPINPADPTYPDALRRVLPTLSPGQISDPILLDVDGPPQFAIIILDELVPPARQATREQARPELERLVRLREERLLMDALSRRLLSQARVAPIDPSANWSWESRQTR
ncbi:MAG: peptidylprolyl isomerase [Phycisphaerales bacterium JB050]